MELKLLESHAAEVGHNIRPLHTESPRPNTREAWSQRAQTAQLRVLGEATETQRNTSTNHRRNTHTHRHRHALKPAMLVHRMALHLLFHREFLATSLHRVPERSAEGNSLDRSRARILAPNRMPRAVPQIPKRFYLGYV